MGMYFSTRCITLSYFFFLSGRRWFYNILLIILGHSLERFWITNSENIVKLLVTLHLILFLCSLEYSKALYFEIINFSFSLLLTAFFKQMARWSTKLKIISYVTGITKCFGLLSEGRKILSILRTCFFITLKHLSQDKKLSRFKKSMANFVESACSY